MKFFAPIESSLYSAIRSAKRLHGHPIAPTTRIYWSELLREGRRSLRTDGKLKDSAALGALICELEAHMTRVEYL